MRNPFATSILMLAWLVATLMSGSSAMAQRPAVSEHAVKATLLFKLPQFIYRPDNWRAAASFGMCLLGRHAFDAALEKLAQEPIGGRPVKLLSLAAGSDAAECDVVFVARSEVAQLDPLLRRLGRTGALTVSDIDGFARAGGMIELSLGADGTAISILVNRKAAQKQNIEFSAQLLNLARVVDP